MDTIVQQHTFSKDKTVLGLSAFSIIATLATVLFSIAMLRSHDFKVPVQYVVNDGSVLQTSNWYTLYSLPLFAVMSTAVMLFLAHKLYRTNRIFSIGVLAAYSLVSIVGFLVTFALLNLVSKV